jgi:hypothetical protein
MTDTLLIMSTIGVPLYSARGLSQSLAPVSEAKPTPRRTINGELRFLGIDAMRKYSSDITCTDQNAPALSGIWPGMTVMVDCITELAYPTVGGSPERTVVSSRTTDDGYTYYRPRITFMVVDVSEGMDEYQHDYQWKLSLLEI